MKYFTVSHSQTCNYHGAALITEDNECAGWTIFASGLVYQVITYYTQ